MKVKVTLGSDIRVWRRKKDDIQSLKSFVSKSFEQLQGLDFLLTYQDDEGERVTLADNEDLQEAFECADEEKRKSLKVFIILKKQAQGINKVQPGAFQPKVVTETKSGEEIVSEPGEEQKADSNIGVKSVKEVDADANQERNESPVTPKSDAVQSPRRAEQIPSNQIEGLPTRQSVVQWVRQLLPLLADHGVAEELKDALPELFVSLDSGDELGTAIQSMIARCPVLQEQSAVQEFMRHVQSKVAPLSGEIVPHVLRLGVPGMRDIVSHLGSVASQWKSGVTNLHFDMTPIFLKLWPAFIAKMESQNQGPCDIWLDKIKLPAFAKMKKAFKGLKPSETRESSFKETPFGKGSQTVPNYRLAAVEDENKWSKPKGSWRQSRLRRRGRGGRGKQWKERHYTAGGPPQNFGWGNPNFPSNPYSHSVPNPRKMQNFYPNQNFSYFERNSNQMPFHNSMPRWDSMPPAMNAPYRRNSARKHPDNDMNQWERGLPQQTPSFGRNLSRKSATDEKKSGVRISATPLKADFIDHVNIPLRSKYLPNQKLMKKWCVRNVGCETWDGEDVSLHFTKGDNFLPTRTSFKVPPCKSGALCELSAMIQTPTKTGRYTAYFRLVKGDVFFGPRIWVDVHVVSNEEELAKDDEQTAKRLERFEKQQQVLRESPINPHRVSARRSQKRTVRETTINRRSRKKSTAADDKKEKFSGLGLVEVPVPRNNKSFRESTEVLMPPKPEEPEQDEPLGLDIRVTEPKPKQPETPYKEQLTELKNMGFGHQPNGNLLSLLNQHKGDVSRVVEDILSQQSSV